MSSKVVHWELMGQDADALAEFYRGIFDWQTQAAEGFDGYHLVSAEQTGVGGAIGKGFEHMPNYLTIYLEVESIDEHLGKIEAAGGKTVMPRTVIPGTVTFGLFSDPAGNVVGLVEAVTPAAE